MKGLRVRTPHRPGAAGATPPRERRGEQNIPLLPEEGWRAQRDGVVGSLPEEGRDALFDARRGGGSPPEERRHTHPTAR